MKSNKGSKVKSNKESLLHKFLQVLLFIGIIIGLSYIIYFIMENFVLKNNNSYSPPAPSAAASSTTTAAEDQATAPSSSPPLPAAVLLRRHRRRCCCCCHHFLLLLLLHHHHFLLPAPPPPPLPDPCEGITCGGSASCVGMGNSDYYCDCHNSKDSYVLMNQSCFDQDIMDGIFNSKNDANFNQCNFLFQKAIKLIMIAKRTISG